MAPQVGLYQGVGHQPGISLGHASAGIDRRGKVGETRCINARTKAHDVSLTWLEMAVTCTDVRKANPLQSGGWPHATHRRMHLCELLKTGLPRAPILCACIIADWSGGT